MKALLIIFIFMLQACITKSLKDPIDLLIDLKSVISLTDSDKESLESCDKLNEKKTESLKDLLDHYGDKRSCDQTCKLLVDDKNYDKLEASLEKRWKNEISDFDHLASETLDVLFDQESNLEYLTTCSHVTEDSFMSESIKKELSSLLSKESSEKAFIDLYWEAILDAQAIYVEFLLEFCNERTDLLVEAKKSCL